MSHGVHKRLVDGYLFLVLKLYYIVFSDGKNGKTHIRKKTYSFRMEEIVIYMLAASI